MKSRKTYSVLLLILLTIIFTIAVQYYLNYKNFQNNSSESNKVILSCFNKSFDVYYELEAKKFFYQKI